MSVFLGSELSGETVSITAGGDFTLRGTTVAASEGLAIAAGGDVVISGENVTIDSQLDIYDYSRRDWSKQSGVSIGLGFSGGAVGGALSSGLDAYNNITSAQNAKSDRAAALYGMAAARDLYVQFLGTIILVRKRGYNLGKLKVVLDLLINEQPLPVHCRDHQLKGDWKGFRDAHIEPDWLLIYAIEDDELHLARTGTHADIFG